VDEKRKEEEERNRRRMLRKPRRHKLRGSILKCSFVVFDGGDKSIAEIKLEDGVSSILLPLALLYPPPLPPSDNLTDCLSACVRACLPACVYLILPRCPPLRFSLASALSLWSSSPCAHTPGASWKDMKATLRKELGDDAYKKIYGLKFVNPAKEGKTCMIRNEEEWKACWAVVVNEKDRELEVFLPSFPFVLICTCLASSLSVFVPGSVTASLSGKGGRVVDLDP